MGLGIEITLPFERKSAAVGNGMMIALDGKDKDQAHKLVLEKMVAAARASQGLAMMGSFIVRILLTDRCQENACTRNSCIQCQMLQQFRNATLSAKQKCNLALT